MKCSGNTVVDSRCVLSSRKKEVYYGIEITAVTFERCCIGYPDLLPLTVTLTVTVTVMLTQII